MLTRCCGMRLSTAGVVIGWLGIVGSIIALILMSIGLADADALAKLIAKNFSTETNKLNPDDIQSLVVIICSVYLGVFIINLLSSTLLVVGTVKERHLLLVPWLINSGLALAFSILYDITVWGMMISKGLSFGEILPSLIFTLLVLVFQFYIYYAIYSLFKQIEANREQQRLLVRQSSVSHSGTTYPSYTKI